MIYENMGILYGRILNQKFKMKLTGSSLNHVMGHPAANQNAATALITDSRIAKQKQVM